MVTMGFKDAIIWLLAYFNCLWFVSGQACTEGESCSQPNHVSINNKNEIAPQVVTLTKVLSVGVSLTIQKENPSDMNLL